MAEGLNVEARLNASSFTRGLENMKSKVANFGRQAPRMVGAGLMGAVTGGVSGALLGGGASASFGLGNIQDQAAFAHGITGMHGGQSQAISDLEKEFSVPGQVTGLFSQVSDMLKQMRGGSTDQELWKRAGMAGITQDMSTPEAVTALMQKSKGLEGTHKQMLMNMYSGLEDIESAGLTPETLIKRLANSMSDEDFSKLVDANREFQEKLNKWNRAFDEMKVWAVKKYESANETIEGNLPSTLLPPNEPDGSVANAINKLNKSLDANTQASNDLRNTIEEMN